MRLDPVIWVRVGAGAFVALAIIASAVESRRTPQATSALAVAEPTSDPLGPELERCGALPPTATPDAACERAWAANRARFLGEPASTRP